MNTVTDKNTWEVAMKYKIGDKVRVREWDDMANEYGMSDDGDILTPNFHFIESMKKFCGMPVVIVECDEDENYYSILEDVTDCAFTDEMLVPVDESVDEKIHYTYCGDWQILECNGFETSGHSISAHDWCDLLRYLGHDVEEKEISDEEMEELC